MRISDWSSYVCSSDLRQVGGDDDRGVFVKSADEMKQQLPASAGERQIAQFVEDQEVEPRQMLGELSGAALVNLHLEPVYKIGRVVEANASTGADATARDSDTQMRFSRARPTDEHDIALVGEERPGGAIAEIGRE